MIVDAQDGIRGMLFDLDTCQPIRWAYWADLATGEYKAFCRDPAEARRLGIPLFSLRYAGKARLRFVPAETLPAREPAPAAAVQAPALPPARRKVQRLSPFVAFFQDRRCEHYACDRLAAWKTAEEVELPPSPGADGKSYERAKTVAVRFWCDWHYQWPQTVHPDGSKSPIETVKVRPD